VFRPLKPGVHAFTDYPLAELAEYIDWTPFFHTWELSGQYPRIFDDPKKGEEARKLFADAQAQLSALDAALYGGRAWNGKEFWKCMRIRLRRTDIRRHASAQSLPTFFRLQESSPSGIRR